MGNITETKQEQIAYAIFNKHSGVLFETTTDKNIAESYNKEHFLTREITLLPGQYFFGDYNTGKVYYKEEVVLVREDEMEANMHREIFETYPFDKQLIMLVELIEKNKNLVQTEEYKEFLSFLKKKKTKHNLAIKAIKENPECFNFVSCEDIEEIRKKRNIGIT